MKQMQNNILKKEAVSSTFRGRWSKTGGGLLALLLIFLLTLQTAAQTMRWERIKPISDQVELLTPDIADFLLVEDATDSLRKSLKIINLPLSQAAKDSIEALWNDISINQQAIIDSSASLQGQIDLIESSSHPLLTKTGTGTYVSLNEANQVLTVDKIDLTTDVTGLLPDVNIASASTWNSHISNTNNPHSVGLNQVTNISGISTNSISVGYLGQYRYFEVFRDYNEKTYSSKFIASAGNLYISNTNITDGIGQGSISIGNNEFIFYPEASNVDPKIVWHSGNLNLFDGSEDLDVNSIETTLDGNSTQWKDAYSHSLIDNDIDNTDELQDTTNIPFLLEFVRNHSINSYTETDSIFAADSANIVHFDELDYFTNAYETDQVYAADSNYLKSHVRDETIHFTQGEISIPANQITNFDTEVANNSAVVANSGKDTTGIYHANRQLLDDIDVSDTTRWGTNYNTDNQQLTIDSTGRVFTINLEDGGQVIFEDTDTQLTDSEIAALGYIKDYIVTENDVTQHQSALVITESQITDLVHFTNTDETDQVFAADSANIVHFNELDYFTNSDELDPIALDSINNSLRPDIDLNTTHRLADNDLDNTNELQTISKVGSTVTLSNGGGSFTDAVDDADNSATNELQDLSLGTQSGTNIPVNISSGTGVTINVADNDNDPTNELQDISGIATNASDIDVLQASSHPLLTKNGTGTYITLNEANQILTVDQIDLTTDVTELLPDVNIASASTWNSHISNTNNPHSVGLNQVTNISGISTNSISVGYLGQYRYFEVFRDYNEKTYSSKFIASAGNLYISNTNITDGIGQGSISIGNNEFIFYPEASNVDPKIVWHSGNLNLFDGSEDLDVNSIETTFDGNSTQWNDAYSHSQITTGNPHQLGIVDLTDGSNVVTINGSQTISGLKTISSKLTLSSPNYNDHIVISRDSLNTSVITVGANRLLLSANADATNALQIYNTGDVRVAGKLLLNDANTYINEDGNGNMTFTDVNEGTYTLGDLAEGYNNQITSASVTGTTTKTITLNQQDGGTVTASFTDETGSGNGFLYTSNTIPHNPSGSTAKYISTDVLSSTNIYSMSEVSVTVTTTTGVLLGIMKFIASGYYNSGSPSVSTQTIIDTTPASITITPTVGTGGASLNKVILYLHNESGVTVEMGFSHHTTNASTD